MVRTVTGRLRERGAAILLALLIMVAMTALGILAVTVSQVEVTLAGNYKAMKRAQYLAEAGLMVVGDHITRNPLALVGPTTAGSPGYDPDLAIGAGRGPEDEGGARAAPVEKQRFDLALFGQDGIFLTTGSPDLASTGYDRRPVDFVVTVEDRRDLSACPGFSTNSLCCKRVTLTSEGKVGATGGDALASIGSARRKVRAQYLVPYPCAR